MQITSKSRSLLLVTTKMVCFKLSSTITHLYFDVLFPLLVNLPREEDMEYCSLQVKPTVITVIQRDIFSLEEGNSTLTINLSATQGKHKHGPS